MMPTWVLRAKSCFDVRCIALAACILVSVAESSARADVLHVLQISASPTVNNSTSFDLDCDGVYDFSINTQQISNLDQDYATVQMYAGGNMCMLASPCGATIGPSSGLASIVELAVYNYWFNFNQLYCNNALSPSPIDCFASATGYVGVRLGQGPVTRYGWVRITASPFAYTVHDGGFETEPGVPVIIPCTPAQPCVPIIDSQPVPSVALTGGAAAFDVGVDRYADCKSYSWRKVGQAQLMNDGPTGTGSIVSGVSTRLLVIRNVTLADTGSYECVVTNPCGSIVSTAAALTLGSGSSCPADFDGVNGLGVPDIFAFLSAWFAGCP